jgi:hypothetical protein
VRRPAGGGVGGGRGVPDAHPAGTLWRPGGGLRQGAGQVHRRQADHGQHEEGLDRDAPAAETGRGKQQCVTAGLRILVWVGTSQKLLTGCGQQPGKMGFARCFESCFPVHVCGQWSASVWRSIQMDSVKGVVLLFVVGRQDLSLRELAPDVESTIPCTHLQRSRNLSTC